MFPKWTHILYDPDTGSGGGATPPANPPTGGANEDRKFTQADLDRIVGERAKRAEESAVNKLLESLNVKSADELKGVLDAFKKQEDEKKSELQKAQDTAAKTKAELEKARADSEIALSKASEQLLRAAVMLEAQKASVDDAEITSVWRELRDSPKLRERIKQDEQGEFEGVADAVKEIVKAHPKWLKTTRPQPIGTTPPRSDARGNNAQTQPPTERRRVGSEF